MFALQIKANFKSEIRNLQKAIQKGNEKAVRKSGPKLRGIMRRLIRRRKKKVSAPGQPPFSHVQSGQFGLKMIVYKYFKQRNVMEVGPILRNEDVPGTLEHGGSVAVKLRNGKVIRSHVQPRPFAVPALKAYMNRYPEEYRNIISG